MYSKRNFSASQTPSHLKLFIRFSKIPATKNERKKKSAITHHNKPTMGVRSNNESINLFYPVSPGSQQESVTHPCTRVQGSKNGNSSPRQEYQQQQKICNFPNLQTRMNFGVLINDEGPRLNAPNR